MSNLLSVSSRCSVVKPLKCHGFTATIHSRVQGRARLHNCTGPSERQHPHPRRVENQAMSGSDSTYTDKPVPNAFWRAFAALLYIVPTIDTFINGVSTYSIVPQLLIFQHIGSFFAPFYWSSQFTALIVFFLIFLAIVKNKKLHHFVRFNGMQAMMLDILVMLPTVSQAYIPPEIAWTFLGAGFQGICFVSMACTLLYSFFFTLAGKYADIPFVSDAVYMQVHQCDLM